VFLNFEPLRLYILKYILKNATIRHYPQLQRPIFSGTMCLSVQNALETIDGEIIVIDNNSLMTVAQ
jgi:hypothetical protein